MARLSSDERRKQLIEAAIAVMARDGVARATTRAIVAEAGMPLGVFHYCFRSKEELLICAIETINERTRQQVVAGMGRQRTLRTAIRAALRGYLAGVEQNPGEHQVTYEVTQYTLRQPAFEAVARRQYEQYQSIALDLLDAMAQRYSVRWTMSRPVLARYLLTVIEGVTLAWLVDRDTASALAVLDQAAGYFAGLAVAA